MTSSMTKRIHTLFAIAAIVAMLGVAGCKNPYGACAKAGADIASGIGKGMTTVQDLEAQGVISATEAINVLGYLEYANKADEAFLTCVASAHGTPAKSGAFTACAQAFNSTLNNPSQLALIHVNDSAASSTVSLIVQSVSTAVTAIVAGLKGA